MFELTDNVPPPVLVLAYISTQYYALNSENSQGDKSVKISNHTSMIIEYFSVIKMRQLERHNTNQSPSYMSELRGMRG